MPLINYIGNRQECLDNKRGGRGNAPAPIFLDYLAVGGGGYGTTVAGGGGGVVSGSIRFLPRFTLDVIVGNGGLFATSTPASASIIDTISPAGEFFVYAGGGGIGQSGNPQFNNAGISVGNYSKPGAGGSAETGSSNPNDQTGGSGGSGSFWMLDISGSFPLSSQPGIYGGGGGGYGTFFIGSGTGGVGGQGGGGRGQDASNNPADGINGMGGGGGGAYSTGSNGGSGIVKMRYISGSVNGAIGGTIQVANGYVYHTFTGSGQFIYQP